MSLLSERPYIIALAIASSFGERLVNIQSIQSGNINKAYCLTTSNQHYFLKINSAEQLIMFEAEFDALNEIANLKAIGVPRPIQCGVIDNQSFLVLEWRDLYPLGDAAAWRLGNSLAALHRHTAIQFGWHRDNTIGMNLQINTFDSDWVTFWKEHRLRFQLRLAEKAGYTGRVQDLGRQLLMCCDALFDNYSPFPSLLHGDLWAGNIAIDAMGEPIIFDPATYYGDRETDLAMTSLFGGFPNAFIAAYHAAWPINDGYKKRRDFYNVYHLLNHLNLFGASYLPRVEATMRQAIIAATK